MCRIRNAELSDVDTLMEIQATSLPERYTRAVFEKLIEQTYVHVCAGVITGYIQSGISKKVDEICEPYAFTIIDRKRVYIISSLAVREQYRNKGIGSQLLATIHRISKNPSVPWYPHVILQVRESNPAGKLYDRYGFKTLGILDSYYPNPAGDGDREDGIAKVLDVTMREPLLTDPICID